MHADWGVRAKTKKAKLSAGIKIIGLETPVNGILLYTKHKQGDSTSQ